MEPRGGDDDASLLAAAVLGILPDAVLVVDADGRIVSANARAEAMFGYPPGELAGPVVDALVPERFRGGHSRHRADYLADAVPRPMGSALDLWAVRLDGAEFPVDISLAPLTSDGQTHTLVVVRDLTARRAEWEAQARLASIVSSTDDAIVSADLNGTLTSWNPGAERLLGYRADAVVGRPVWRLVPDGLRAEFEEHMARLRGGGHIPTHDTLRLHQDGHQVDVGESLSLVRDPSGRPTGVSAVMRDISVRKRSERELKRLLVDGQRRERWLGAISEVRLAMLGGGALGEWIALIARRVSELADADGMTVSVPAEDDDSLLEVIAAHGAPVEAYRGRLVAMEGTLPGRVFRSNRTTGADDPTAATGIDRDMAAAQGIGPFLLVPINTSHGVGGVLGVVRQAGRVPFSPEEVRVVESFGQQAGLAIELDRAQADREQLALIGDRERIARDLHDHVIQRLFAVGMTLQSASHSITDPPVLERIGESVEELDATIRDVRSTIFSLSLRATEKGDASARSRILDVASAAVPALGFQPRLQFDGPVDTKVAEELVPDVLAVVREALSNAARHAHASRVDVRVDAHDDLAVIITDDGAGIGDTTRASGLANLRARAEARGGTMTVGRVDGRGTRLCWRVPFGD